VFQPLLFAGQYVDVETAAYENDGVTVHRPGIVLNGYRTYDPFGGSYVQPDPYMPVSRSSYGYADGSPVSKQDPFGLMAKLKCELDTSGSSQPNESNENISMVDKCRWVDDGGGHTGGGGNGPGDRVGVGSITTPAPRWKGEVKYYPTHLVQTCAALRKLFDDAYNKCLNAGMAADSDPNYRGTCHCNGGGVHLTAEDVTASGCAEMEDDGVWECHLAPPEECEIVPFYLDNYEMLCPPWP
jgi:RHS repeat-associated protein